MLVTGGQVNLSLCLSCWPVLVCLVFVFVFFCFVVTFDLFCFCFGSFDLIGIVMTSLDCVSGLLRHRIPGETKNRKKNNLRILPGVGRPWTFRKHSGIRSQNWTLPRNHFFDSRNPLPDPFSDTFALHGGPKLDPSTDFFSVQRLVASARSFSTQIECYTLLKFIS